MLVLSRGTSPISSASFLEVGAIVVLLAVFIDGFALVGATAAMIALVGGRLLGNAYLARPSIRAVRNLRSFPT